MAEGLTVNGLVVGGGQKQLDYYRSEVVGGPGAFVFQISDKAAIAEAMKRKFIADLIAWNSGG